MLIRFPNEHQDHHLKRTSWWQHIKQHPKITVAISLVIAWIAVAPLLGIGTDTDDPAVDRCVHQLEQAADAWFGDRPHGDQSAAVAFCQSEQSR